MTIDGRPSMKGCPSFSETAWKIYPREIAFFSIKLLYINTKIILDYFGAADVQKGNTIRRANRRQREKDRLKIVQRLFKKRFREMPDDRESVKKILSVVKERMLVIAWTKNAPKRRPKGRCNFEKRTFKFTKKLFGGGGEYTERGIRSAPSKKIYRPTRRHSSRPS